MAAFSAREQLMLELINRARLNPNAEAARQGITLNQGIGAGTISGAAKQPLAPNELLVDSARAHSQWMIDNDIFDHIGAGGSTPFNRMTAAGYGPLLTAGENIAFRGTTGSVPFTNFVILEHNDLFKSTSGHRENILNPNFREIGIGALTGQFTTSQGTFNSVLTTQNFATHSNQPIVTGVAYNDTTINDNFYSVGEGRSGITVTIDQTVDVVTTTAAAGGYAATASAGAADVTFSGGGLATPVTVGVTLGSLNVKIDLVNSRSIESSASTTLKSGALHLKLLGIAAINGTGNASANHITGNDGKNKLFGGDGKDILTGGRGADTLNGGPGADDFDFNSLKDSGLSSGTRDIIRGFQRGIDDIDLRGIDAKSGVAGNQAFKYIGMQSFHHVKGELHLVDTGANIRVEGDVNGDGKADFQIMVIGVASLAKGDFLL
ncbi:MAG: CAP domain-containing protein [Hyphomicrobiaceae bacterium]